MPKCIETGEAGDGAPCSVAQLALWLRLYLYYRTFAHGRDLNDILLGQPTKSSKLAIPTTLALTVQAVSHGCYSVLLFLVLFQALTAESLLSTEKNVIPAYHRRAYVNTIFIIQSAVAATSLCASTATKVVTISVLLF